MYVSRQEHLVPLEGNIVRPLQSVLCTLVACAPYTTKEFGADLALISCLADERDDSFFLIPSLEEKCRD